MLHHKEINKRKEFGLYSHLNDDDILSVIEDEIKIGAVARRYQQFLQKEEDRDAWENHRKHKLKKIRLILITLILMLLARRRRRKNRKIDKENAFLLMLGKIKARILKRLEGGRKRLRRSYKKTFSKMEESIVGFKALANKIDASMNALRRTKNRIKKAGQLLLKAEKLYLKELYHVKKIEKSLGSSLSAEETQYINQYSEKLSEIAAMTAAYQKLLPRLMLSVEKGKSNLAKQRVELLKSNLSLDREKRLENVAVLMKKLENAGNDVNLVAEDLQVCLNRDLEKLRSELESIGPMPARLEPYLKPKPKPEAKMPLLKRLRKAVSHRSEAHADDGSASVQLAQPQALRLVRQVGLVD